MGASKATLWKSGIVPYTVDPSFTLVNALKAAFTAWESVTNLRFVQKLDATEDHVAVQHTAEACASPVGLHGGAQVVGCAPFGFGTPGLTHELGHSVGLIHEQSRSDRDAFVTINSDNIQEGMEHNFELRSGSIQGMAYDFRSLMHYGANAFSNGNGPTIEPITPGTTLNGSNMPTAEDIAFVNTLYPFVGVVRRSDSTGSGAGKVKEAASVGFAGSSDQIMTAVRTDGGSLRLIQWRVGSLGGVGRVTDTADLAGAATHVDISRAPSKDFFVTACRAGNGRLLLISWESSNNTITRLADSGTDAGAATLIKIEALTDTVFVTACRTSGGNLLLISWRLNPDGSLTRLEDSGSQAGAVNEVSMCVVTSRDPVHVVATTVRMPNGRLRVITWRVRSDTGVITKRGDSAGDLGVAASIDTVMSPSGHLLVACQTDAPTRRLKLIAFSISSGGGNLVRLGDSGNQAGKIVSNAIVARAYGALSAITTADGKLRLIKWSVSSDGQISRIGDSGDQVGKASLVGAVGVPGVPDAPVVTPVKTDSGNLMLLSWDDQSTSGELQR